MQTLSEAALQQQMSKSRYFNCVIAISNTNPDSSIYLDVRCFAIHVTVLAFRPILCYMPLFDFRHRSTPT